MDWEKGSKDFPEKLEKSSTRGCFFRDDPSVYSARQMPLASCPNEILRTSLFIPFQRGSNDMSSSLASVSQHCIKDGKPYNIWYVQ
jgi:hypothetical protein